MTKQNWQEASQSSRAASKADLVIGRYNTTQGLLAVHSDPSGVRLLFASEHAPGNRQSLAVHAYEPSIGRIIKLVYAPTVAADAPPQLMVHDVDVVALLSGYRASREFHPGARAKLRNTLRSNVGSALMDGIAALCLQLDDYETDGRVVQHKIAFGMPRTTLEMITGQYQGLDRLDALASPEKAKALKAGCAKGQCALSGTQFWLHDSGLFDVWSARKTASTARCAPATAVLDRERLMEGGPALDPLSECNLNSQDPLRAWERDCFGACGWGCTGSVYLLECCGHDNCVAQNGHFACLWGPVTCSNFPCHSLLEALEAWWRHTRFVTFEN